VEGSAPAAAQRDTGEAEAEEREGGGGGRRDDERLDHKPEPPHSYGRQTSVTISDTSIVTDPSEEARTYIDAMLQLDQAATRADGEGACGRRNAEDHID
jgi:hypothetical protein